VRVLVVGAGAREHALAWKLSTSPSLSQLMMLPGNPGMHPLGETIEGVDPTAVGAVAALAAHHGVDLVVIGPEAPLAAGLVDALTSVRVPAFGPKRAAARLESSKAFAKEIMRRAGVPTAAALVFTDPDSARAHLDSTGGPYVVKADGLAAGKGVLVTDRRAEARDWVDLCFGGRFGDAGQQVVVEEYMEGPELSVFAVCDGEHYLTLEPARDYKRLANDDEGPNTGGMGSYSPVDLPPDLVATVEKEVIEPTLQTMAEAGTPYVGFLYAGLILTEAGPQVIEFNCRLGDPETQVVIPRMRSDLLTLLADAAAGDIGTTHLDWDPDPAVNVVLASAGYPESPRTGDVIAGLEEVEGALVFHAGTGRQGRRVVTAGGRVLSVVGRGPNRATARHAAYEGVDAITFKGMQYRTDIALD
jgi:phosphoribosylamine---glycine ligase